MTLRFDSNDTLYDSKDRMEILSVRHIIEKIRSENLICSIFKNCTILTDKLFIKELVKQFKLTQVNCGELKYEEDKFVNSPSGFSYLDPDNKFFVYSFNFLDINTLQQSLFVFFNKEEDILSMFSVEGYAKLEQGTYEIIESAFGPVFNKMSATDSIKPVLDDNFQNEIIEDIERFFKSEQFYKDNGFAYKRGLLMYGSPGCGKTSIIKYIGSVVSVPTLVVGPKVDIGSQLKNLIDLSCPDGCVIAFEDIDGIEHYKRSDLLNFLDGLASPKKCYFIATTNHLNKVDYALSRRPSRFDMIIEVPAPSVETRKEIIKMYFKDKVDTIDLDYVAKETEGFSGAFIKELYILFMLNKLDIKKAIQRLKKHIDLAGGMNGDSTDYID